MSRTVRYTVHIDAHGDGWVIQSRRWVGDELIGTGELMHRTTYAAATRCADDLVRHRLAAGRPCVLVLSDEAQAAS